MKTVAAVLLCLVLGACVTSSPPPEPLQIDGSLTAPRAVTTTAPAYTPEAREARIQGVVIVQAIINKEGNVTDVKVLKGLPLGLEESAVETIRTWKFEPATLEGKPVDVYYNLTVNFTIAEEEAS